MKKDYKNLILPIPRSGNYMLFDELADMLRTHGVAEKTIQEIYDQAITSSTLK